MKTISRPSEELRSTRSRHVRRLAAGAVVATAAAGVAWTTGLTAPLQDRIALVASSSHHPSAAAAAAVTPPSCRLLTPREASAALGHRVHRLPADPGTDGECAYGWTTGGQRHVALAVATGAASGAAGSAVPGTAWNVVYPEGTGSPVAHQGTLSAPVRVRLDPGLVPGNDPVAAQTMVADVTRALLEHA